MSRWPEDTSREGTSLSSAPGCTEQLLVSQWEMALSGTIYQRIWGAILMNITAYAPTSQLISVQNMSDLRMYSHLPTPTGSSLLSEGKASQRRPHSGRSWHARCSTLAGMLPLWSLGPGFLAQQGLFLSGDRTLPKACHVTS